MEKPEEKLFEFYQKKLFYYAFFNKKEYILKLNKTNNSFNFYTSYNAGDLLVEILNNMKPIIDIIENTIKKIKEDADNSQSNIQLLLVELQSKLSSLKLSYTKFINIPSLFATEYVDTFNTGTSKQHSKIKNYKQFVCEKLEDYIVDIEASNPKRFYYLSKDWEKQEFNEKYSIKETNYVMQFIPALRLNEMLKSTCYSTNLYIRNDKINNYKDKNETMKDFMSNVYPINAFQLNNLSILLNLSFTHCINNSITISKCKNCQKLFIPDTRNDVKYCNNKVCKKYGAKKFYKERVNSFTIYKEHQRAGNFYRGRIYNASKKGNNAEIDFLINRYNKYKDSYQRKKVLYNNGRLSEDDFKKWIIKQKNIPHPL